MALDTCRPVRARRRAGAVDRPVGRTASPAPVLSRPLGRSRRAPLLARPVAFLERRGWPRSGGLRAVKGGIWICAGRGAGEKGMGV
jgi:hypothetical protein